MYTSLSVDSSNGVHISYYDLTNKDLKYAYKPSGSPWTVATVDSTGKVGKHTDMAVDSLGGVHISYFDQTNYDLKYAYKPSGGSWSTSMVDSTGDVGRYTSIAIDSSDGVHVSYYDYTNKDLKYAYKPSGSSWTISTIDSTGDVGRYTSISVDSSNGVYICNFDRTNSNIKYMYKPSGGSFSGTEVSKTGIMGRYSAICVDSNKNLHIGYYDSNDGRPKYGCKNNGGFYYGTDISGQCYTEHVNPYIHAIWVVFLLIKLTAYILTRDRLRYRKRGTSPVIAIILMLAITVVLAAVCYTMLMEFAGFGSREPVTGLRPERTIEGSTYIVKIAGIEGSTGWESVAAKIVDSSGNVLASVDVSVYTADGIEAAEFIPATPGEFDPGEDFPSTIQGGHYFVFEYSAGYRGGKFVLFDYDNELGGCVLP
jgi:flagellin-like protein